MKLFALTAALLFGAFLAQGADSQATIDLDDLILETGDACCDP